ncbi:MAG: squalene/phytoene synthase family protein [Alphaproteobacteria bacterium]|nr:MAG: squalene/phytoene synthase family protein [Alphaproteobacteria bacterium]
METAQDYCLAMVRAGDHARYLTALYADRAARPALLALYAFNLELARVREAVSEPLLGEIRFAWWRETVESLYGGHARAHPVAQALAPAIARARPPAALFGELIDGRMADIDENRLRVLDDVMRYGDMTGGAVQELAAWLAAGGDPGPEPRAAARAVGRAWALMGLVRAIAFHARLGRRRLPDALLAAQGIDAATLYRGEITPAICDMARALHAAADAALADARRHCPQPAPAVLAALLPAVLAEDFLKRLARAGYNLHDDAIEAGALARQAKLMWAALRGRI